MDSSLHIKFDEPFPTHKIKMMNTHNTWWNYTWQLMDLPAYPYKWNLINRLAQPFTWHLIDSPSQIVNLCMLEVKCNRINFATNGHMSTMLQDHICYGLRPKGYIFNQMPIKYNWYHTATNRLRLLSTTS